VVAGRDWRSGGAPPGSGLLDYDAIAALAREFRPLVLLAGYSAYPRTPNFAVLREIADEVGATFIYHDKCIKIESAMKI
jgi:glycine hydroxymethyltransferase